MVLLLINCVRVGQDDPRSIAELWHYPHYGLKYRLRPAITGGWRKRRGGLQAMHAVAGHF